jgi:hypothetical protein
VPLGQANSAGLGLESQPSTMWQFFSSDFQFFNILENSYKFQICVENTILLEKI